MSTKQSDTEEGAGKVSAKKSRLPQGLDLADLNYLEHRDVQRVAETLNVRADFVSKVKRGECYSVKVLSALFKKARENKAALSS